MKTPEIDAKIARLLGWSLVAEQDGRAAGYPPGLVELQNVPNYSTFVSSAMEALNDLGPKRVGAVLSLEDDGRWEAWIFNREAVGIGYIVDENPAAAIAGAIVKGFHL